MLNFLLISYLLVVPSLVNSYSFKNLLGFKSKFNNSLITVSPAGLQGFYTLGIMMLKIIKIS